MCQHMLYKLCKHVFYICKHVIYMKASDVQMYDVRVKVCVVYFNSPVPFSILSSFVPFSLDLSFKV